MLGAKLSLIRKHPQHTYKDTASQNVVRLDLHDAYQAGKYHEGSHADLSTITAFDNYYRGQEGLAACDATDFAQCRILARDWNEVVFGFKGAWWYDFLRGGQYLQSFRCSRSN